MSRYSNNPFAGKHKFKNRQVGMQLTGLPELDAMLRHLKTRRAHTFVAKPALRAGVTVIAREIRRTVPRGKTLLLKKVVRSKVDKGGPQNGIQYRAIAGVNVRRIGGPSAGQTAHPTFVTAGTKKRYRKSDGQYTGQIQPSTYTITSLATKRAEAIEAVRKKARERLLLLASKGLR